MLKRLSLLFMLIAIGFGALQFYEIYSSDDSSSANADTLLSVDLDRIASGTSIGSLSDTSVGSSSDTSVGSLSDTSVGSSSDTSVGSSSDASVGSLSDTSAGESTGDVRSYPFDAESVVAELSKIDHASLKSCNDRYWGSLILPKLGIQQPVVKPQDNTWYLTHGLDNSYSIQGTIFLDSDTEEDDFNKVLHGHCMSKEDSMFTPLLRYLNQDFTEFDKLVSKTGDDLFFCNDAELKWYQVFAVMKFDVNNLSEFDYLNSDVSIDDRDKWFRYIQSNSLWCSKDLTRYLSREDSVLDYEDVLTLSTCDRPGPTDIRIIVFTAFRDLIC